ncbi:OLC1v1001207C1 [Oldenlandia corymbosa var. corymbosa]|uniref:OLC1v1001207C1 n=1 Tax=Oldenlandia corymbosa var. corymbosa TaxID=529605 RepID=A0AAV1D7J9_OLDCO|nr:OLC1v1001207C1 [Oldenlandia corymbosa var. corymbosa]
MVQRKVTNKLGIQADQVKTNQLFLNLIKPSSPSFQHHDSRKIIVGVDSKKKMKKSRPTNKRSDHHQIQCFSSATTKGISQIPQPGKPPPGKLVLSSSSSSPIKKSAGKQPYSDEAMPNYMKPTSSSDARKEHIHHQVSSKNLQALLLSDGKTSSSTSCSPKWKNKAKISSNSSVPNKGARVSLVRTLTKTTSFKPVRSSSVVKKKRNFPGVLSEKLNPQRATCSSTLKDSKFPAYLELNSGGTESEGKSVMKVCPYTYCSLNGHRHPPLPPLRGFLASRRRMLKAQRGLKLGFCTSPRPTKQKENLTEQMKLDDPSTDEEKQEDFFVEIYSKEKEGTAEHTEFVNTDKPFVEETSYDLDNQQVQEILSDGNLGIEDKLESWSHDEVGGRQIIPIDSKEFEFSDTDCEADNYTISLKNIQDLDLHEDPIQFGSCVFPGNWVLKADDSVIRFLEEIQDGGLLQQPFDEEMFDGESISSKAESYRDFEIQYYIEGPEAQINSRQMQGSLVEEDGLPQECGKTGLIPLENHIKELFCADCNVDPKCLEVNHKFLNTIEKLRSFTLIIANVKDKIAQGDEVAEEIWDMESQDFHDMIDESSKAGSNPPSDGEDEEQEEQDDVAESYREEKCSTNEDDIEDTEKHLEPLNGRSDETFAGEETSMISMSPCDTSSALDTSGNDLRQESGAQTSAKLKWRSGGKKCSEDCKEQREFNPRGPNFLTLEPDPEAEKVDLKHQMIDERKNADEWMIDYAIQQAVSKLRPARKKKVALLVEAFETVIPTSRQVQACN